ncbi:DUF3238 domain-containing protein [Microbacterium profundi]|uniref:DUF3238 domain-containing protein n=1 Tax=Microbacterium profundi TaxID=450380 RepID=UPI0027DEE0C4|nr:DUF3238 domain-containing protein [Microbacterium profundi]MCE7483768.1 DUF3238 domain-containing protein [Microbacterium profundi]
MLAVPPSAGWFLYDTFITDQYVPLTTLMQASGCVGQIGQKYGGNNRVYTTPSLWDHPWQYRGVKTGAMAKVDFVNGSPYTMQDKLVAPTYLYNQNGSLAETRTASANGIKFLDQAASSTLYQFRVSHTVGNPFCTSGAIRYEANVNIWKSGVMQLNGYRHPVPHHESYGLFTFSNGSNAWIQMYRGANQSFDCLSGLCATQLLSKTYTPS